MNSLQIQDSADLREAVADWKSDGQMVGFVPTIGNLHAGHLALVKQAKDQCDRVVVSIFVNPAQFGPNEDLASYPRTLDQDLRALGDASADAVFVPSVEQMYPTGVRQGTQVSVPGISEDLCGASRRGHFDGVATVVTKLFNLVQPEAAFFGQKDYQQLLVIRKMVDELCFPIEIVACPTVRAEDGLALSSRNGYLTPDQRRVAPVLYAELQRAAQLLWASKCPWGQIADSVKQNLKQQGFDVEYLELRDAKTLAPSPDSTESVVILVAARLGTTRLIDNFVISR